MWGDSVVKKVNQGLQNSKYILVVLSRSSISKSWPSNELEAILNIEFSTGVVKVLPLLVGGDRDIEIIKDNYPILASKAYVRLSEGLEVIVEKIKNRLSN